MSSCTCLPGVGLRLCAEEVGRGKLPVLPGETPASTPLLGQEELVASSPGAAADLPGQGAGQGPTECEREYCLPSKAAGTFSGSGVDSR